jgi:DNA-binding transcriptional ArsR family regulator
MTSMPAARASSSRLAAAREAAECLRTLAHPHRLLIVEILLAGPCSVGELADRCGLQSHAMSTHLRIMRDRGLLASCREGRTVSYEVAEPHLQDIMRCIWGRFGKLTTSPAGRGSARHGPSSRRRAQPVA